MPITNSSFKKIFVENKKIRKFKLLTTFVFGCFFVFLNILTLLTYRVKSTFVIILEVKPKIVFSSQRIGKQKERKKE